MSNPSAPPPASMEMTRNDPRGSMESKSQKPPSYAGGHNQPADINRDNRVQAVQAVTSARVSVVPPNFRTRKELASMVNNFRKTGKLSATPENVHSSGGLMPYLYCLCTVGWFRCYRNTPTEVQFFQSFNGAVETSTVACGYNPSVFRAQVGKMDFQKMNATNYYAKFGNVHVVFVPEGCYCKIVMNSEPLFLAAGFHVNVAEQFSCQGLTKTNAEIIQHGNTTIFNVPLGRVYVLNDPSNAERITILGPGHHVRTSMTMTYEKLNTSVVQYPIQTTIFSGDNYQLVIAGDAQIKIEEDRVHDLLVWSGFEENLQAKIDKLLQAQVKSAFNEAGAGTFYRATIMSQLERNTVKSEDSQDGDVKVEVKSARSNRQGGEEGGFDQQIERLVMKKLEDLIQYGITCKGILFTQCSPDKATVDMLTKANAEFIREQQESSTSWFDRQQALMQARTEADAAKTRAEGAAAAKGIAEAAENKALRERAEALRDAMAMTPLIADVRLIEACGKALQNVPGVQLLSQSIDPRSIMLFDKRK